MKNLLFSLIAAGMLIPSDAPAGNTFTFRLLSEPETLDWNKAHTSVETHLLMNLMEGLVQIEKGLKVAPAIAESWRISRDGRVYTFKLRRGVKWSDGALVKAGDFYESWKRLLTPATAASYAYMLFDVENAEKFYKGEIKDFKEVGIKAPDDHTFEVRLARPVAYWIYLPTFWVTFPVRKDLIEKHGRDWVRPGKMVTTGPFTLASHELESKIILKANPHYYGRRGNIDTAVGLIVNDDASALALYESGKLDFLVDIMTLDLKRLAAGRDLKVFPYLKTVYIGYVAKNAPVSSVVLRQAISMSIDKSKIPQILHGQQTPTGSFVPVGMMAYSSKTGLPYDPARARAQLKKAGIDPAKLPRLSFLIPNWDKQITLAQYIQSELKKNLGLNVDVSPYDHKTFRAQMNLFSHSFYLVSWAADYPDPDNFLSVFSSFSGNNRTGWMDAAYDALVLKARGMQDKKAREKTYGELQKILIERDAAILPLYHENNIALVRPRTEGVVLNPLNYLILKNARVK